MSSEHKSDLDIARDIEQLCHAVNAALKQANEAFQEATQVLRRATETDGFREFKTQIEAEKASLSNIQTEIRQLEEKVKREKLSAESLLNDLRATTSESQSSIDRALQNGENFVQTLSARCQAIENRFDQIEQHQENLERDIKKYQENILTEKSNLESLLNDFQAFQNQVRALEKLAQDAIQDAESVIQRYQTLTTEIEDKASQFDQLNKNIEEKLFALNEAFSEIGGIEAFREFLDESRNMRALLQETREDTRKHAIAIRNLEDNMNHMINNVIPHIYDYHESRRRSRKKLGLIGLITQFFRM